MPSIVWEDCCDYSTALQRATVGKLDWLTYYNNVSKTAIFQGDGFHGLHNIRHMLLLLGRPYGPGLPRTTCIIEAAGWLLLRQQRRRHLGVGYHQGEQHKLG